MTKISPWEDRISKRARIWSNDQLRKYATELEGDVINISAWMDDDKQGTKYKNYFPKARSYSISNFPSNTSRSGGGIPLNLELPLPEKLVKSYDHVFNHTTLEHIYNFKLAFSNLCKISRESVIVVVPFSQIIHTAKDNSWVDYWRFTPYSIIELFKENNFKCHYLSMNVDLGGASYIFAIGFSSESLETKYPTIPKIIQLSNNLGLRGRILNFALWVIQRLGVL